MKTKLTQFLIRVLKERGMYEDVHKDERIMVKINNIFTYKFSINFQNMFPYTPFPLKDCYRTFVKDLFNNKHISITNIRDLDVLLKYLNENGFIWRSDNLVYEIPIKKNLEKNREYFAIQIDISTGTLTYTLNVNDLGRYSDKEYQYVEEVLFYEYFERKKKIIDSRFETFINESYKGLWK